MTALPAALSVAINDSALVNEGMFWSRKITLNTLGNRSVQDRCQTCPLGGDEQHLDVWASRFWTFAIWTVGEAPDTPFPVSSSTPFAFASFSALFCTTE